MGYKIKIPGYQTTGIWTKTIILWVESELFK